MLQLLHGGAAHKDGRLRVDDRLVAIEDVDLRKMARNAEVTLSYSLDFEILSFSNSWLILISSFQASEAITAKLKQIGQRASRVSYVLFRFRSKASEERIDGTIGKRRLQAEGMASPGSDGSTRSR